MIPTKYHKLERWVAFIGGSLGILGAILTGVLYIFNIKSDNAVLSARYDAVITKVGELNTKLV